MKKIIIIWALVFLLLGCDLLNQNTETPVDDSDGDGYTDTEELDTYFYDESDPLFFNPYIADVPKISFELTDAPTITINGTKNSETQSISSLDTGSVTTSSVSTSNSSSQSSALTKDIGATYSAEAGFSAKDGWSGKASVSVSHNKSNTHEMSKSVSSELGSARTDSINQVYTQTMLEGYSISGGKLQTSFNIINNGRITFTLTSITLLAKYYDPASGAAPVTIGELTISDDVKGVSIAPGASASTVAFTEIDDPNLALRLLEKTNNIIVSVGSYQIEDANGKAFAYDMDLIGARTFNLIIDYGLDRKPESHYVAPSFSGSKTVALSTVLSDLLQIDFAYGTHSDNSVLYTVRDKTTTAETGSWLIYHTYSNSGIYETKVYSPAEAYSLDDIIVRRGETVQLIYAEDKDHDGLLAREEFFYGSLDTSTDSDGDGISDYDEVQNSTNPALDESKINRNPSAPVIPVSNVSSFTASLAADTNTVNLAWNPPGGVSVIIVRSESAISGSLTGNPSIGSPVLGGTVVYKGGSATFADTSLANGKTYYYRAYCQASDGRFSSGLNASGAPLTSWIFIKLTADKVTVQEPLDGESRDGGYAEFYWKFYTEDRSVATILHERPLNNTWEVQESDSWGNLYTLSINQDFIYQIDPAGTDVALRVRGYMMEYDGDKTDDTYIANSSSYYHEFSNSDLLGGSLKQHYIRGWLDHSNGNDYNICSFYYTLSAYTTP